jgi:hypothetical protein
MPKRLAVQHTASPSSTVVVHVDAPAATRQVKSMRIRPDSESDSNHGTTWSRRSVIAKSAAATMVAIAMPMEIARAALCQDPEELSHTDYSFRKYVEYTEAWPNKEEACRHCAAFLPAADENACGNCRAIAGSISPNGHCNGWERKKNAG